MPTTLVLSLQQDEQRALAHALDAWELEKPSTQELALRRLVARLLEEPLFVREVWRTVWTAARAQEVDDYQMVGQTLRAMFETAARLLEGGRRIADAYTESTGRTVEGADELATAAAEVRRLGSEVLKHWPWIDQQRVAEAMAEYRRGEYEEAPGALPRTDP